MQSRNIRIDVPCRTEYQACCWNGKFLEGATGCREFGETYICVTKRSDSKQVYIRSGLLFDLTSEGLRRMMSVWELPQVSADLFADVKRSAEHMFSIHQAMRGVVDHRLLTQCRQWVNADHRRDNGTNLAFVAAIDVANTDPVILALRAILHDVVAKNHPPLPTHALATPQQRAAIHLIDKLDRN